MKLFRMWPIVIFAVLVVMLLTGCEVTGLQMLRSNFEEYAETDEDENDQIYPEYDPAARHAVVLDPGHGGHDCGAYYDGLREKDLTLKVAQYARDYLISHYENIDVFLTREDDCAMDGDKKTDLEMRCDLARQVGADCLVSIHFNASDSHVYSGAEVWASGRNNVHDQTFLLGECILQELASLGIRERSVSSKDSTDTFDENGLPYDYYAINRHSAARDVAGIIVEQCFMDSEEDRIFVSDDDGLKQLGEANARGIAAYLGLVLKEDDTPEV